MSQWAEIRHLHLVEGVPKKEIARRLQLDVKTVRRAVDQPTAPERVSPPRVCSLDPWREQITQWLRDDSKCRLMWCSTLVDEVGYLGYDARAADLIFQLVSRRYEHRSLLITTNLPFKRWDTVFPNASCAVALIDRLTHHAEILLLEGNSFRRREARAESAGAKPPAHAPS